MSRFKSCIIILKPTSFFTSFVAEQLPDFECPDEEDIALNHTAYTIPAYKDDEVLLEHLERLFPFMFRHEVTRVIGKRLAAEIKADFLDFLYCFKFEVHAQSVLMESSIEDCQHVVCVKPRVVDLKWLPQISEDQIEVKEMLQTLSSMPISPTAWVLVKKFDKLADLKPFVQRYCRPLLRQDFIKKTAKLIQWPSDSSMQLFHNYFSLEVHTQLVHLQ